MAINLHLPVTSLNVNGLNFPIKIHRVHEWVYRKRPQLYAFYKRLGLTLKTHTDWEWKDGQRYSKQMVTRRELECLLSLYQTT